MLRQEQYHQLAEDYQVNIGIAEWTEPFYPQYRTVSKMPDSLKVAILTSVIIRDGIYQQTIREVLRLKRKYGNKRINESTIYEKAITNITER